MCHTKEHPPGGAEGRRVWSARTEEKASLPPRLFLLPLRRPTPTPNKKEKAPVGLAGAGCGEVVGSRAHVHGYRHGVALFGKAYAQEADAPPLGNGASEVLEGAFSTSARRGTGELGVERQGGTGPVSSDVGWVLATEDAGEGVTHGGARSPGGEREGVAEGAPTAPRVDVAMPALGVTDMGYRYRAKAGGWEAKGKG